MKVLVSLLYISLTLMVHSYSYAESDTSDTGQFATDDSDDSNHEFTLVDLLDAPQLSTLRETCDNSDSTVAPLKQKIDAGEAADDYEFKLAECVWNAADDATKDQIRDALGQTNNGSGNQSQAEAPKYSKLNIVNIQKKSNPALDKVKEFLGEQLREALYGEVTANNTQRDKVKVVDDEIFNSIYETRVSKNLIETITSFCIGVKIEGRILTYDESLIQERTDKLSKETPDKNRDHFVKCATAIDDACTYKSIGSGSRASCEKKISLQNAIDDTDNTTTNEFADACHRDEKTKDAACQALAGMKLARNQLFATQDIREAYEKNRELSANTSIAKSSGQFNTTTFQAGANGTVVASATSKSFSDFKNIEVYTGRGDGEKMIDDITTITSKDFEDNYKENAEKLKEELNTKCASGQAGGVCDEFIDSSEDTARARKGLSEYAMRSKVMLERLRNDLDPANDSQGESLSAYLKEEGYTDEQIEKILEDDETKKKVISHIIATYSKERESLIKKMSSEISLLAKGSGGSSSNINTIADRLVKDGEKAKSIIHYSNIISGYIDVQKLGSGSGNSGGSQSQGGVAVKTNAVFREAASTDINADALKSNIENSGIQEQNSIDEMRIEVDSINILIDNDSQ